MFQLLCLLQVAREGGSEVIELVGLKLGATAMDILGITLAGDCTVMDILQEKFLCLTVAPFLRRRCTGVSDARLSLVEKYLYPK